MNAVQTSPALAGSASSPAIFPHVGSNVSFDLSPSPQQAKKLAHILGQYQPTQDETDDLLDVAQTWAYLFAYYSIAREQSFDALGDLYQAVP